MKPAADADAGDPATILFDLHPNRFAFARHCRLTRVANDFCIMCGRARTAADMAAHTLSHLIPNSVLQSSDTTSFNTAAGQQIAHSQHGYRAFCKLVSGCEDKLTFGEKHLNPQLHLPLTKDIDQQIRIADSSWLHHALFTIAWRYLSLTGADYVGHDGPLGAAIRSFLKYTRPYIFHQNWARLQRTAYADRSQFMIAMWVPTSTDVRQTSVIASEYFSQIPKPNLGIPVSDDPIGTEYCGRDPAAFSLIVHMGPVHFILVSVLISDPPIPPDAIRVNPTGEFLLPRASDRIPISTDRKKAFFKVYFETLIAVGRCSPLIAGTQQADSEATVTATGPVIEGAILATTQKATVTLMAPGGRFVIIDERRRKYRLPHHTIDASFQGGGFVFYHLLRPNNRSLNPDRLDVLVEVHRLEPYNANRDLYLWLIAKRLPDSEARPADEVWFDLDIDPQLKTAPLFSASDFCKRVNGHPRLVIPNWLKPALVDLQPWLIKEVQQRCNNPPAAFLKL